MTTAVETTGTIEQNGHLVVAETFPVNAPTQVRVIVLFPEDDDVTDSEWYRAAKQNDAFEFLADPAEDIYSLDDGKPVGT